MAPAGRQTRQLALVAVCLLGLLVAAFAAPPISGSGPGVGPPGSGSGSGGGGSGDSGDGGGAGIEELLRWLFEDSETDGETDPGEDGTLPEGDSESESVTRTPRAQACAVSFRTDPRPGERVAIDVRAGDREVEGARVFLNGEFVGETDTYGRVRTRVPYERQLTLGATLPSDVECERVVQPAVDAPRDAASLPVGPSAKRQSAVAAADPNDADPAGRTRRQADGNVTNTYSMNARVEMTVDGQPIPGEQVDIRATVDGIPMRQATVTVGGNEVGKTDDSGEYELDVPADGGRAITVGVSRGDFEGQRRIQLARLTATLNPATVVAIPGGETHLRATIGDQPIEGAVVSYQGERLAETDAEGRTTIELPSDLGATISVEAAGQRTTKAVWPLYAGSAIIGVLALVAGVLVLAVLVYGVSWLPQLARWLASAVVRLAAALEGFVVRARTQLGRLRLWLADLLAAGRESIPALLTRLGSWLLDLPGRALAGLLAVLGWLRRAPGRLWRWLWSFRRSDDEDDGETVDTEHGRDHGRSDVPAEGPTGLREQWRAFARWIAPRRWRQRTPGEVARDAVDAGFPAEPVRRLTAVFRDVEYGNAQISDERRERAREAFESLSEHRRETTGDRRGRRSTDGSGHRPTAGTGQPPETGEGTHRRDEGVPDA